MKIRGFHFLSVAVILSSTVSSTLANYCDVSAWGDSQFGWGNWVWDPATYYEVANTPPPTGTVKNIWENIATDTKANCTLDPISWKFTYTKNESESINHSMTGQLETQVALKVGQKDVGEVGLQHATVTTNGWQYIDTWSSSIQDETTIPVGACSAKRIVMRGKYRKGDHKGVGWIDFFVRFRLSFQSWQDGTGECARTTSNAVGLKKYVSYASRVDSVNPNCAADSPCKKCTVVPILPGGPG